MSRKLLTTLLVIAMVVPAAFAKRVVLDQQPVQDNRVQVLMPGTNVHVPTNVFNKAKVRMDDDLEIARFKSTRPAAESATREDDIWQLKMVDDNAEYYLGSGAAADTFAMVFTPAAPAIIQEVYQQWFSAGNAIAFLAEYNADAALINPTGICCDNDGEDDWDAGFPYSLLGPLLTNPTPIVVTGGEQDWTYPMDVGLVDGTDIIIGSADDLTNVPSFVVAFVKGGATPQPLADATSDQGTVTHTWFGGPWNAEQEHVWEAYNAVVEVMTMVEVTYPYGAPIAVSSLEQKNNTFYTSGPFSVETVLFDDLDDNNMAISSEDEVLFHWTDDGGVTETSGAVTAVEVGADGNGTYGFDIIGDFEVGDEIEYWITSTDNDGLQSTSMSMAFEILEAAYPDAELLFIDENLGNDELMIYRAVADAAGIVYEYWSIEDNGGIDASVLGYGWENIIHYGWGASSVPMLAGDDDPGYAAFLDAGGNYVLIDQDYFYGHTNDPVITFTTGDFAYDYLGLGSGNNDPADDDGVSTADTSFFGIGGTSIDVTFTSEAPLSIDHIVNGTSNWGDDFIPSLGTALFAGTELGLTYGCYYESGTFNTAYISFMADAAVDTVLDDTDFIYPQFTTLLTGVFDWMGFGSPAQISDVTGPSGQVLSGPYAVSATIIDADDDAITAMVVLSGDEGATWTEIPMTADGDMYSASIADPVTPGMYYWGIVAESGDQSNSYPPENEEAMSFERLDFTPTAPTLVVFNGMDKPTAAQEYPQHYYFGIGDFATYGVADFAHDLWDSQITAELASFYTTIYEITTAGPNDDNSDVISDWLDEGAKNYFLAGDEWFGALTGWADQDYAAGDFEYDILGISHIHNDINASSSAPTAIEAVDGNILTGALYTAHMAAGDTLLYDPTYEIEIANWLDGFTPVNAADVNMTTFAMTPSDTVYSIGLNRVVGDDKIVFAGYDPLSINATPYTWWGFSEEGVLTQSLTWFGVEYTVSVDKTTAVPTEFKLAQNYPNPFNPSTSIRFEVPNSSEVLISVYNMLGQKVVDLVNDSYAPGVYNVQWNGTDANGKPVGSGLYIYHMNAGKYSSTNKMLFLK